MIEGCNHPMGPLHLADLIGLDTTLAVAESLYTEFKEPLYAAAAAAEPDGRSRPARPQDRARLLRLLTLVVACRARYATHHVGRSRANAGGCGGSGTTGRRGPGLARAWPAA